LDHFHILIFFSVPVQTSGQRTRREDGYHSCCHCCCMRRNCGKWPATFRTAYILYCTLYEDATGLCSVMSCSLHWLFTAVFRLEIRGMSMVPNRSVLAEIHRRCRLILSQSSTDCSRHLTFWLDRIRCCTVRVERILINIPVRSPSCFIFVYSNLQTILTSHLQGCW